MTELRSLDEIRADLARADRDGTPWPSAAKRLLADVPTLITELDAARTERDQALADRDIFRKRAMELECPRCMSGPRGACGCYDTDNPMLARARTAEAERDALAAKIEAVKAVCAEVERDDIDHLDRFGQHLPGSVVCVAEMVRAALSGVGGNPTPAVEACALTHPHPAHPRLGPPCNGLRFHEIRAGGVSGSPEGHNE